MLYRIGFEMLSSAPFFGFEPIRGVEGSRFVDISVRCGRLG
jgi:hypothetical protein